MKRYKHLWEQFISMENLELAAKKAVKSKKNKKDVREFLAHKDELLKKLQSDLINGRFKTSKYKIRKIYEPKERDIYILPLYPDHIVHHALINIVGPIWQSTFIHDSFACIPGRGLHAASQRVMDFVRKYKYVLQCDIKKFYPSINHQIMFNIVKKKIADDKLLNVLHDIIFSVGESTNLPIGNLTSQWMGNVYMNELDHFVKEKLHSRAYIRYCDDFLIFSNDKSVLHRSLDVITRFLFNKLNLIFSKSFVYPIKRGVVFIGYRHFKKFILLRKYSAHKIIKRIFNIIRWADTSDKSVGQLAAFHGWVKWCNSFNFKISVFNDTKKNSVIMLAFLQQRFFVSDNVTDLTMIKKATLAGGFFRMPRKEGKEKKKRAS